MTYLDQYNAQNTAFFASIDADVASLQAQLADVEQQLADAQAQLGNEPQLQAQVDELTAQVADLQVQLAAAQQTVSDRDGQIATLTDQVGSLTDALHDLQAAYDAYVASHPDTTPPPPPPPTGSTVFGAGDDHWPVPGVAKLPGVRVYLQPGHLDSTTSWTTAGGQLKAAWDHVADKGTIWLSIKDNKPDQLDRILKQFKSLNTTRGLSLVVTFNHEPENDVKLPLSDPAKKADIAAYQAAWRQLLPVIQSNGARAATCLLGDKVSPNSPDNPESVAYHVPGVDYCGFDRYNPGLGNATTYLDPHTVLKGCVQFVLNRSKEDGKAYPLAIGEWGTIAIGSDDNGAGGDQAGRRQWAKGYVAECRAIHADPARPNVPVVLWWNAHRMAFNTDPAGTLAQNALGL